MPTLTADLQQCRDCLRRLKSYQLGELGLSNGAMIEVVEGLEDGEQVVVVGHAAVKPGAAVRIVNTPARPAARTVPAVAAG
jgi:hypothetical protein